MLKHAQNCVILHDSIATRYFMCLNKSFKISGFLDLAAKGLIAKKRYEYGMV